MYYILMTLFDIGFYITENWRELTLNALACGIGVIIGKRLGSRLVVQQMMKLLGLEKKSKLEQKVDFLIDIEAGRGNVWVGNTETLSNTDQRSLKRLWTLSPKAINPANQLRRKQKMREYLKKLGSRKFQSFVVGFITQLFILLKVDEGLYVNEIAAGGLIVTTVIYIWIEGSVDKARGQSNEPDYSVSDDTAA